LAHGTSKLEISIDYPAKMGINAIGTAWNADYARLPWKFRWEKSFPLPRAKPGIHDWFVLHNVDAEPGFLQDIDSPGLNTVKK